MFQKEFSYEKLKKATNDFNEDIHSGSRIASLYKGCLNCTDVAVKVVDVTDEQGLQQFKKQTEELEWLRHPHIVQLLGVCKAQGCLVYEFMDNGSLLDYLNNK